MFDCGRASSPPHGAACINRNRALAVPGAKRMLRADRLDAIARARASATRYFAEPCRASIGSAETCAGGDAGPNPYRPPVRRIPMDARQAAGRSVAPSARDIDDAVRDLDRIRGGRARDRRQRRPARQVIPHQVGRLEIGVVSRDEACIETGHGQECIEVLTIRDFVERPPIKAFT